jgi:hypothetical protein
VKLGTDSVGRWKVAGIAGSAGRLAVLGVPSVLRSRRDRDPKALVDGEELEKPVIDDMKR